MKINEMKKVLARKLKEEGCYFTEKDIEITPYKKGYKIIVGDYTHIPFYLYAEPYDDYFGYVVSVYDEWSESTIIFVENKTKPDVETALIRLGYHVGVTF